ncbi:hypothetical protein CAEBREN_04365 [Caenorhabditis brenneri]|uniref:Uncharacterized protein n=1 Tax=Caenorhabditis brenneri TaxID=135651 RepID=G0MMZ5_CAEBE|nr:hypothetical protein CAEBREN_04365 [Caenorhabditis brenneri]
MDPVPIMMMSAFVKVLDRIVMERQRLGSGDSSGKFTWWINDFSTLPTTASTPIPTTVPPNQFTFDISLSEGRDNKKNHLAIASELKCNSEQCSYTVQVDNSAQAYFKVFVGSELCQNSKCSGTFLKSSSVNVTVYRDGQVLDLFDFEYVDTPRIVVLGCEDGLTEYGNCIQMVKAIKLDGMDYVDEVCSCRSTGELDCKVGRPGVCRRGDTKWWRDAVPTTVESTPSTSTPVPTTSSSMPSLKDLSNSGVGLNNVTQVLNDTNHYSKQGESLNHTQIFEITKILHNSANLVGISEENAIQILQNMDQCLNARRREIRNGQTKDYRLLNVLWPMVRNTKDRVIQYLHGRNLGFNAKKVDCKTENHTDDGMIYYGPDKGYAVLNDTNKLAATTENSIIVPLGTVCQDEEISHVFFTIFRGQKLFSGRQKYRTWGEEAVVDDEEEELMEDVSTRYKRNSQNGSDSVGQIPAPSKCSNQLSVPNVPVMSASIMAGNAVDGWRTFSRMARAAPIAKLQFNVGKIPRPLHGSNIVSWYDNVGQEWSLNEQCKIEKDQNGLITANCEHLTDFTVLIYGQLDAEYVCSWPLIIIGYSVNGASIVCLLLLIIIGLMFYIRYDLIRRILSYLRGQAQTSGDVINLAYYCIFFLFFILSLFFMDQSSSDGQGPTTTSTYCVVIAAVSYFSLISAIIMSMLIGIRMICHFFSPKLRAFFGVMTSPPAALSIGLIIPFTFTMILAIFDTQFFERNDSFCWVRPDYIVYAVVVPVVLPIINGLICSTFAIYKMFFQAKRGLGSKETSHYDAEFWSKVVGLLIMQVAMGLPWGIEFILIGVSGPSPWNYIFVILLGTQGIDLFLIFLYRRQRLVNESRKWSAREEKLQRKRHFTAAGHDGEEN